MRCKPHVVGDDNADQVDSRQVRIEDGMIGEQADLLCHLWHSVLYILYETANQLITSGMLGQLPERVNDI